MREQPDGDKHIALQPMDFDELRTRSGFVVLTVEGATIVECERQWMDDSLRSVTLRLELDGQAILVQSTRELPDEYGIRALAENFLADGANFPSRFPRSVFDERSAAGASVDGRIREAVLRRSGDASCLGFTAEGQQVLAIAATTTGLLLTELPYTFATGRTPEQDRQAC